MPAAVVGAVGSGLLAYGAGTTIFGLSVLSSALLIGGSQLVLGAISYGMTPKPKKPGSAATGDFSTTTSVRQSDLTRQIAYGHTRITRGYAQIEVTEVNDRLHIVLILCEGELRAINEVWMGDYSIPSDWIDADGNVTEGRYANYLTIRKHLGSNAQVADPLLVENLPEWTNSHRLQGIAYLYLILTKNQDIYPNGVPNVTAIVEGATMYDPRLDAQSWSTNISLYAHDFIRNDAYGFGAFQDDVDLTNISAQANICDEIVATDDDPITVSEVDSDLDLLEFDQKILPYQFGDQVEVASTGSLPAGLSAATSYYVIPYQILDKPRFGLATSLANAMAKNYINITTEGSGVITVEKKGEPRYHGSGVIDTETTLSETLNHLASCMAGRAINVAGFWTLLAGAWREPDVEYGISDVRNGGIQLQNALSMSDSFNVVKGLFISSLNLYQQVDYPSAFYQQFVDDDNGLESSKEINLPFTNRPTTAQRIAKIELFRGRQGITVTADFSMKAIRVQTGDNVNLTIDRYGWEEKPFEVTRYTFANNEGALFAKMVLRETAEAIYDWSAGEAITYDPAPNSTLPDIFNVQVPSGVAYNSSFIDTVDGDAVYTLTLSWNLHPDAFVREFGDFEVQYKLSAEDVWRPSWFVDGLLTQTDVVNSSVNIPYDLRIRARNNLGVHSAWQTIEGAVVGSSGGITDTEDYGAANVPADSNTLDYGFVYDAADSNTLDYGYVV